MPVRKPIATLLYVIVLNRPNWTYVFTQYRLATKSPLEGMTVSNSESTAGEGSETTSVENAQSKTRFKKADRDNNRRFKALGTSSSVEETGTEDIPSCQSFAIAGFLSMLVILGITGVLFVKTAHYLKEQEESYRKANGTNSSSSVTPETFTLKP